MSRYVEPDYWEYEYAVGDTSTPFVFGGMFSLAQAEQDSGGNYIASGHRGLLTANASLIVAPIFFSVYPGVDLNTISQAFASGSVTSASNGAIAKAHSDSRMTGRPFWELTAPASGTWTRIVPQAEGSGE